MSQVPAELQIGGLQRFTSIDYPGALAAVVFVQGCAWRCVYCHNPHLQARAAPAGAPRWHELRRWLCGRRGLLDAVIFSGGEPTLDPALPAAAADVRALGFRVGLHTAGMAPRRLRAVLPHVDWVGLDIKAPLGDAALHDRITGVQRGAKAVLQSLALLLRSGVALQCRTTAHTAWLSEEATAAVQQHMAQLGVAEHVIQPGNAAGRSA